MNIAYILNDTPVNGGATKAFVNMLEGLKTYDVKSFVVVPNRQGIYIELKSREFPYWLHPFVLAPTHTAIPCSRSCFSLQDWQPESLSMGWPPENWKDS